MTQFVPRPPRSQRVVLMACAALVAFCTAARPSAAQTQIRVHLVKLQSDVPVVSFGLPLGFGMLTDSTNVHLTNATTGASIGEVNTKTLLQYYDQNGKAAAIRALLIQFPGSELPGATLEVQAVLNSSVGRAGSGTQPYARVKFTSTEITSVTTRSIVLTNSVYSLRENNTAPKTLYVGTEPTVLATYPDGYLASTGILGEQMSRTSMLRNANLAGLKGLSDNFELFANSAIYNDGYAMNPGGVYDSTNYEGWLYDRCDTFLTAYAHLNAAKYLRYAYRACSFYAASIKPNGITSIKPEDDIKYSHARGLFAYYALTGDEVALTAIIRTADMWASERTFVKPYQATGPPYQPGHIRSSESLWTERLLAASIEGLVYGYLATGAPTYKSGAQRLFETAYVHITTPDASTLDAVTRTAAYPVPPQGCFIHSAYQQAEGMLQDPWCSMWMSELLIDSFLRYQEITGDVNRVDTIFIRLGRYLRDVGSMYYFGWFNGKYIDWIPGASFLDPKGVCYDPNLPHDRIRRLVAPYGSGTDYQGVRHTFPEWDDWNHSPDSSAIMAVAIRSLIRQGGWNTPWVHGPFRTEGEAFTVIFHEFMYGTITLTFDQFYRTHRIPSDWTSAQLSAGYFGGDHGQQTTFIDSNKIGYQAYATDPQRKLSWWFNTSMLNFSVLEQTGLDLSMIRAGFVQPPGCAIPATSLPPTTPNPRFTAPAEAPTNLHIVQ